MSENEAIKNLKKNGMSTNEYAYNSEIAALVPSLLSNQDEIDFSKDLKTLKHQDMKTLLLSNQIKPRNKLLLATEMLKPESTLTFEKQPESLQLILKIAKEYDKKTSVEMGQFISVLDTFDEKFSTSMNARIEKVKKGNRIVEETKNETKNADHCSKAADFIDKLQSIFEKYNKNAGKNGLSKETFEEIISNNIKGKEPMTLPSPTVGKLSGLFMSGLAKEMQKETENCISEFNSKVESVIKYAEVLKEYKGVVLNRESTKGLNTKYTNSKDIASKNDSILREKYSSLDSDRDIVFDFEKIDYKNSVSSLKNSVNEAKQDIRDKMAPVAEESMKNIHGVTANSGLAEVTKRANLGKV